MSFEESVNNYADSMQFAIEMEKQHKPVSTVLVIATIVKTIDPYIFKLDADGNIVRNKKGKPRINWSTVLTNLVRILGALLAIRNNLPPKSLR